MTNLWAAFVAWVLYILYTIIIYIYCIYISIKYEKWNASQKTPEHMYGYLNMYECLY